MTTTITIPEDLYRLIAQKAEERGKTVERLCFEALLQKLDGMAYKQYADAMDEIRKERRRLYEARTTAAV